MKRMLIGWAIGTVIALILCILILPSGKAIGGLIVGGVFSNLGLWLGSEWDLRRAGNSSSESA